jgi:stage II sporulation protein D
LSYAPAVHDRKGPKASNFIEFYKKQSLNDSPTPIRQLEAHETLVPRISYFALLPATTGAALREESRLQITQSHGAPREIRGRDGKVREAAQVEVVGEWERLKSCLIKTKLPRRLSVPCMNRRLTTKLVLLLAMLLLPFVVQAETSPQAALSSALRATPAVGVVVDLKTGQFLATVRAANQPSAPGSILKPLFLAGALEQHEVLPQTTVFCRRNLRIVDGVHEYKLPCTHPQSDVAFAAQEALAYSCNQYFAALADRIPTQQLAAILQHYGLPGPPSPLTREQKQLLVLGVAGIAVSPTQMAAAYRKLFLELDKAQGDAVGQGLKDSVRFGMAHNAAIPGVEVAGKTGTTTGGGWFAGSAPLGRQHVIIVIYLPRGNGADAARLAQHFLLAAKGPATVPESARDLTVELFSARPVTHLTATALSDPKTPLEVEWKRLQKPLILSGRFRLQAAGEEPVIAAGKWTITSQQGGLRVLLTLPSEAYVLAALNGEAAPDEPLASLKVMAISMRTFALENANRHSAQGFGLCDSTHCQALRLGKPRSEVELAVRETAGETLWSGDQRAHIYYTQHCGGRSESAAAVWPDEQVSYLAGNRTDPYCLRRSHAEWHAAIPLAQLSDIFRAQGWHTPSPIADIRVTRRSSEGRAELLEVTGRGAPAQLSASSFRFAVDRQLGWNQVRSDWYTATVAGAVVVEIQGKGYGHGAGLCQAGAYEMAMEGKTETEILNFYFPGTVAGITPAGNGWQKIPASGWTLLSTEPSGTLLADGNAAWAKAQSLFAGLPGGKGPTVQELPTVELFRQTTGEPGWTLASTRGDTVFLQPAGVRQSNGGTGPSLLHEFLHVLVERQAGGNAPLWLREGLVEILAGPQKQDSNLIDLPVGEVDAALAHPSDAAISRHAHRVAAHMTTVLCAHYGMPAVRNFLRYGVPSEAMRILGS